MLTGLFGVASWAAFLASYISIVCFMIDLPGLLPSSIEYGVLPHGIDTNPGGELLSCLIVDVLLLGFFAIPHSIFARPAVKERLGAEAVYRSAYVLQSSLALFLIILYWRPVFEDVVLWDASGVAKGVLLVGYVFFFLWTTSSTFAIDHFELFGITQSTGVDVMRLVGFPTTGFVSRLHYKLCRHPIMFGFFGLFFCVPTMTVNHLFFSSGCTAYILLAVTFLEEPDLMRMFPVEYSQYKAEVR